MMTNTSVARMRQTRDATALGKPCCSSDLEGPVNSKAIKQAKAKGFNISCPTYRMARMITRHTKGFTSFANKTEVDEDLQILIIKCNYFACMKVAVFALLVSFH